MEKVNVIERGMIFLVNLVGKDHVQKGLHPVLIVSNNKANTYSPNVTVCPISSKIGKRNLPTHIRLRKGIDIVKYDSDVQAEGLTIISKKELLGTALGKLSNEKMIEVNKAISIQLAI